MLCFKSNKSNWYFKYINISPYKEDNFVILSNSDEYFLSKDMIHEVYNYLDEEKTETIPNFNLNLMNEIPYINTYKNYLKDNNFNIYGDLTKKQKQHKIEPVRDYKINTKIQNNEKCPCNSNKKYKQCYKNK